MTSVPMTSLLERRVRWLRRSFVAEMVLRSGPFWDRLEELRELYGIEPTTALPPQLLPGRMHHVLFPEQPNQRPYQGSPITMGGLRWPVHVEQLFSDVVPEDLRLGVIVASPETIFRLVQRRRYAEHRSDVFLWGPWARFLSACGLFDPPRHRLLDFADSGFDGDGANVATGLPNDGPSPPVRYLRDADAVEEELDRYWSTIMADLRDRLWRDHELDIEPILEDIATKRGILAEHERRMAQLTPVPVIDAGIARFAVREEIVAAVDFLRGGEKNPGGRTPEDPLVSVQCAIWHDELGHSVARIAKRMRWKTQDPLPGRRRRRSESARVHIAEGRRLLEQARPSESMGQ